MGVGLSASPQVYDVGLPIHPPTQGESLHCYKLPGRERYKLTNSKLPKVDTPSEKGTERTKRQGTVTLTAGTDNLKPSTLTAPSTSHPYAGLWCCYSLKLLHLCPTGPGQYSILRTLPYNVLSLKYWLYSSQRVFSHTFKLSSQRAADNVTIQPGFLLTCFPV